VIKQGKTRRETAEYYGFKDKLVVNRLLQRAKKKERTVPPHQEAGKDAATSE